MLIIVAATYFISWAPLNALNFIINVFDSSENTLNGYERFSGKDMVYWLSMI